MRRVQWLALLHWHRAWVARRAARRLPEYSIGWAVISPSDLQADHWDYHLILTEWGREAAERLREQEGGWILQLREAGK